MIFWQYRMNKGHQILFKKYMTSLIDDPSKSSKLRRLLQKRKIWLHFFASSNFSKTEKHIRDQFDAGHIRGRLEDGLRRPVVGAKDVWQCRKWGWEIFHKVKKAISKTHAVRKFVTNFKMIVKYIFLLL